MERMVLLKYLKI